MYNNFIMSYTYANKYKNGDNTYLLNVKNIIFQNENT